MADFELEDLQGNRYRLRRGSGPGLYHPENLCTGGNFDAERLLGHFSTSNIDDSFNHFYFDVLSKLDDRPSCPRQALTKAIAANYLTLEKVDTARAVDDEVPDDRPFLRVQIENALRQIVEGERREAAMHQRQMDKESTVMKGLIYTGAFMTGIGSSAWGLAVQVKELSDVINPFKKMEHHAKALRAAWESDNFADTYAETYLSGEKRELVEAIGFDPSQITQQQIDEAIAMTDLVLNDETLRDILYRFVKDYAEAQHAIEITEVAGSGAFELILTIIVAAVTGGAGVVAAVGSKMHLVRKFNKVGDLLADFAKASKRIKNRKNAFNGKNTGPGKLESVDGSVKKTDAHGAETGEVSHSGSRTLFRRDSRPPDVIFADGFQPHRPDANVDLEDYVDFNVPSQYVGTSKVKAGAAEVNTQSNKPGYIYEISDPGHGIDVNDVYPENPFAHEQEIAFPGGIDACNVKGCTAVDENNIPTSNFIENQGYNGPD